MFENTQVWVFPVPQERTAGLLTKEDLVKRLKFAKKCKQLPENIWTEWVSFYFDGTGWVHKINPVQTARARRTRMWRKRGEGLKQECSDKEKKEGTAGRMAKFFVVIAYGKGVIGCHQYEGHVNGEMFREFLREQNNHKLRAYSTYLTVWFLKTYFDVEGKLGFLEILRFISFSCNCILQ